MTIRCTIGVGLVLFVSSAMAEGWSVGGGLSGAKHDDEFCDTFSGVGIDCEDTDSGIKLFAGYDINENFRIEWFFADLGEARADDVFGDSVSIEADGIGIAAMPMGPLSEKLDVFGRLGIFSWDATATANISGLSASESDDGSDPFFGFGARYHMNDQASVRIEWDFYELDDFDVTTFTIGVALHF